LSARIAMFEGDLPRSLKQSKLAEAMGRRLEDPEVEALGLIYRAHVELATGEIKAGLLHIDEAGAAALSGTVTPWACGFVFCSVIWAYLDRGDIGRAGQWTDQFIRWSKAQSGYGYPGLCRLHRGEVLCVQGKLTEAELEIQQARDLLAEGARYAEGDAFRVLGEIRLLRGDLAEADAAFAQAYELGWTPIPGWPLAKAAQGKVDEALTLLERGLTSPSWADGQRRGILLAHFAQISARNQLLEQAKKALTELQSARDLRSTCGCEAAYQQARAEVAFADKDYNTAVEALRDGLAMWLEASSDINVAHLRFRLSEILRAAGAATEAELELNAAEKAFAKMNAPAMVRRCQEKREALSRV
jgi:tetratricopeptide (TPR) repeat protein